VHLLDDVYDRAWQERMITATLMASPKRFKGSSGGDLVPPDPDDAVKQFEKRLSAPFDAERRRAAALRLVSGA
jgi:hypothetical protein